MKKPKVNKPTISKLIFIGALCVYAFLAILFKYFPDTVEKVESSQQVSFVEEESQIEINLLMVNKFSDDARIYHNVDEKTTVLEAGDEVFAIFSDPKQQIYLGLYYYIEEILKTERAKND